MVAAPSGNDSSGSGRDIARHGGRQPIKPPSLEKPRPPPSQAAPSPELVPKALMPGGGRAPANSLQAVQSPVPDCKEAISSAAIPGKIAPSKAALGEAGVSRPLPDAVLIAASGLTPEPHSTSSVSLFTVASLSTTVPTAATLSEPKAGTEPPSSIVPPLSDPSPSASSQKAESSGHEDSIIKIVDACAAGMGAVDAPDEWAEPLEATVCLQRELQGGLASEAVRFATVAAHTLAGEAGGGAEAGSSTNDGNASSDYDSEDSGESYDAQASRAEAIAAAAQQRIGRPDSATAWSAWRATARLQRPEDAADGAGGEGPGGGLGAADRWSDWDVMGGRNVGVSAWARDGDDDELAGHVRIIRNARHLPPMAMPAGAPVPEQQQPALVSERQPQQKRPEGRSEGCILAGGAPADESPLPETAHQSGRGGLDGSGDEETEAAASTPCPASTANSGMPRTSGGSGADCTAPASSTGLPPRQLQQPPAGASRTPPRPPSHVPPGTPHARAASPLRQVPPSPSPPPPLPGSHYAAFFGAFHEVLSICYSVLSHMSEAAGLPSGASSSSSGSSGAPLAASRPASRASAFHPSDVIEKYRGLMLRCRAWLGEAERQRERQREDAKKTKWGNDASQLTKVAPLPEGGHNMLRYYAVADDTSHPEVGR